MSFSQDDDLSYFAHMKRHPTQEKLILEGKVESQRNRGWPHRYWEKDVEDWMGQVSG